MRDWPKFVSHKVVQATPIVRVLRQSGFGPALPQVFVDANGDGIHEAFVPTVADMAERAEVGGYAVIYEDGFRSISPKAIFEAGYTPCPNRDHG